MFGGDRKKVRSLVKDVRNAHANTPIHQDAIERLAKHGSPRAVKALLALLEEGDSYTDIWGALKALRKLDVPSRQLADANYRALKRSKRKWGNEQHIAILLAMAQKGDRYALDILRSVLRSNNKVYCQQFPVSGGKTTIRRKLFGKLASVADGRFLEGDKDLAQLMIEALTKGDDYTRADAAKILGHIGVTSAMQSLKAATRDKEFCVRNAATKSLKKLNSV